MNLQTIIFIGLSGSGKGTQIQELKSFLQKNDNRGVFHLQAGDKLRSFINEKTYVSSLAKEVSEKGGLQPEFLSIWAWSDKMLYEMKENEHLLVDGAPRRIAETKILDSVFDFLGRENVHIIYLNVSKDWATEKMKKRGRDDDKEMEDILTRLNWFDTEVVPVIDYYRAHKNYHFHEINGEQALEKVTADILKALSL